MPDEREQMRRVKAAILAYLDTEPVSITVSPLSICAVEGTFDLDGLAQAIIKAATVDEKPF